MIYFCLIGDLYCSLLCIIFIQHIYALFRIEFPLLFLGLNWIILATPTRKRERANLASLAPKPTSISKKIT